MLSRLRVKDFAIIDELEVEFGDGLTVVTGETGAGKSILIGALEMLLGARAHPDLIRAGKDEAVVEGTFMRGPSGGGARRTGVDHDGVSLSRRLAREGRGKAAVNGSPVTLSQLEEAGRKLLGIYGQHEYMDLLDSAKQTAYLDEFGGLQSRQEEIEGTRKAVAKLYEEWKDFEKFERSRQERLDLLRFQTEEIEKAGILAGEDDALEQERRVLANAEKISQSLGEAEQGLYSMEGSAVEKIARATDAVEKMADIDARLRPLAENLSGAKAVVRDVAEEIAGYLARVEFDPKRLESVEERLYFLDRIKKKHGTDLEGVLRRFEAAQKEMEELSRTGIDRADLEVRGASEWKTLERRLVEFLRERRKHALALAKEVERGCGDVGLAKSRFSVEVLAQWPEGREGGAASWTEAGSWLGGPSPLMTVTYFFSANPGEPLRELSRVASGGETSRIMLVLKNILSKAKEGATLIFDEVDAGIGGAVAEAVGRKLRELSRCHRILCITHLPQIACFGDTHFLVRKRRNQSRTVTEIVRLDESLRLEELARMLGGEKISEKARAYAAELLRTARRTSND